MNTDLIKARLVSFAYEAGTLIASSVLGVFVSPDFAALVQAHFGVGMTTSLILLIVTGAVKHLRNLKVLKDAGLGAGRSVESAGPLLI